MKLARFYLKFRPNKPLTCSLEPQYLGDLKSGLYSPEYSRSQNPWGSDMGMRKAIIPSVKTQSCSCYATPGGGELRGTWLHSTGE